MAVFQIPPQQEHAFREFGPRQYLKSNKKKLPIIAVNVEDKTAMKKYLAELCKTYQMFSITTSLKEGR